MKFVKILLYGVDNHRVLDDDVWSQQSVPFQIEVFASSIIVLKMASFSLGLPIR